jgi:hypothetical protein
LYSPQNDCWHYIRNIEKALWHAAKLKSCGAEIGKAIPTGCKFIFISSPLARER